MKPMPFYKKFLIKENLNREMEVREKGIRIAESYSVIPYTNLDTKNVYLPFFEPLDLRDLKVLLKHEIKHLEVTKEPAIAPPWCSLTKTAVVANILEDIVINEGLNRNELERVFRKLGATAKDYYVEVEFDGKEKELLQITLWGHFTKEEKVSLVEKYKKLGIIKSIETDSVVSTIDETVSERKKFTSLGQFSRSKPSLFKKFIDLFADEGTWEAGDGPGESDHTYYLPDWNLYREIKKHIYNLKSVSVETRIDDAWSGKRVKRRFIENPLELKPFETKTDIVSVKKPKVVAVLDCSGSMQGTYEKVAKAFLTAFFDTGIDLTVVAVNTDYLEVVKNREALIKLYMKNDENFDKLIKKKPGIEYKADILVAITDMIIDDSEAKGLNEFLTTFSARRKYLLVVKAENLNNYPTMFKDAKRILWNDREAVVSFIKKLVAQYS